jgi:hypothetical protein
VRSPPGSASAGYLRWRCGLVLCADQVRGGGGDHRSAVGFVGAHHLGHLGHRVPPSSPWDDREMQMCRGNFRRIAAACVDDAVGAARKAADAPTSDFRCPSTPRQGHHGTVCRYVAEGEAA